MHATRGMEHMQTFAADLRTTLRRHAIFFWILLISIFAGLFAMRQQHELATIRDTLVTARPGWLAALVLGQLAILGIIAQVYRLVLRRLGHQLSHLRLVRVHLQRHVIGTVTPVGGPASVYVFMRSLARDDVPADDALLALALRSTAGYSAFIALLIPALALSSPSMLVLGAAGALAVLLAIIAGGLILLLRGDAPPAWLERIVPARVTRFVARIRGHHLRARDLAGPFLLSIGFYLSSATMLYISLHAIGVHASPLTVLSAYAVGNLFSHVAPVFQGIGLVEAGVAVTLQQLGVPGAAALSATLLYRAADIWLPLALGLLAQASEHRHGRRALPHAGPFLAGATAGIVALLALLPAFHRGSMQAQPTVYAIVAVVAGLCGMVLARGLSHWRPAPRFAAVGATAIMPALVLANSNQIVTLASLANGVLHLF
jgi:uncharacterized protein (TIRG00374 family)